MEESSDAHMETDVSSTTDDVPESQEVTASQGHVEMVIVVENVDEDDNSSMDVDEPPSKEDDDTKAVPTVAEPSQSQNTVKSSPVKSEVSIQSVQSPAKPDTPHKTPEKSSPIKLPMVNSVTIDQPHTVDSSTRELIRPSMIEKVIEKSPIKNAEIHKSMPVTPVKETKAIEKTPSKIEKSPTKVGEKILIKFGEKSPIKVSEKGQIKVAEKSPIKLVLKTPTKVTEKSPTKEDRTVFKVAEKSPVKDTEKTDIKVSDKSPIKIILPLNKSITQIATPNKEPVNISISVNGESTDLKDTTEKLASPSNNSEMELANDSQLPTDVSEKEHNKSISRELRSLINSAKESKIISECTQLTSKTRKSRVNLDSANTSLNASAEPDKIEGSRRGSNNSQVSNSSEKSERIAKRSMRSQNPEFVSKCKQFLNSVTGKAEGTEEEEGKKPEKPEQTSPQQSPPKKKKIEEVSMPEKMMGKLRTDQYCWRCHYIVDHEPNEKAHPPVICTVCPRSFHFKCLSSAERKITPEKNWVCPDCLQILLAESSESRSPAMKKISLGMLCELLKHALERLMELNGVEPFLQPVDRTLFPDYDKYVVHPMDLSQMKQNIVDGHYGSTEAFTADTQWILHNSIIFNTCDQPNLQSKLTGGARSLVRSCRAEMGEIEACPECYAAAHARRTTWFTDVCSTPHILLWAKLKGFPYWPAKGMTVNSSGLVDVRFFGAHDRAWVPAKDCFLYSEKDPNNFRSKRQDILDSMQEAEEHIRNISRKYGQFVYQPFKTVFDPSKLYEQLKIMIPSFEGEVRSVCIKEKASSASPVVGKDKKRSSSKSSKSSTNDGETSECDDSHSSAARVSVIEVKDKSIVQDESASDTKSKPPEVEATPKPKEAGIPTRKRRRSNLEEAVLTIMGTAEKRKKTPDSDSNDNEDKKDNEVAELSKNAGPKSKIKEAEPSAENKETLRVTPIKLVALPRSNKQTPKLFATTKVTPKPSPKQEDKTQQKVKITRADKSLDKSLEKFKTEKRRNSRNRSVNATSTPKTDKNEKESEPSTSKEKAKDNKKGNSSDPEKTPKNASDTAKPSNKKINFDDDTSLAVIARETRNSSGLPTISSVRSLSTTAQNTVTTNTKTNINTNTTESQSRTNVFTPTSTDNIRSMKEAEAKLQRLRDTEIHPTVGRVGVRAFARMTSPARNDNVSVEIKGEPVDLDEVDEERRIEKMDLMNACKLRPVNQQQNLRDVRINKVVVTPTVVVKKPAGKTAEVRPRAKKSFPQGKNAEGRSELTCKNSMVYIPIQPPATQAPRGPRPSAPVNITVSNNTPRLAGPGNNANINSVTSPLRPSLSTPPTSATSTATSTMSNNQGPTVGQVPTTVHTVPLMTSVNGQWMFSLQPVMSVGCVDNPSSPAPPIVNGVQDRASVTPSILPINNTVTVTPQNRTSNDVSTPGEPPRLQHRPILMNPLDASTPLGIMPTPSTAGSLTAKLNQSAVKMTDFFRNLLEECIEKLDEPVAQVTQVKLRLEQTKWRHQQEVEEIRHNHELMLTEMRLSFEKEKIRAVNEARRVAQIELDSAVKLAKSKQWCANCSQEAQFYCCWNTSYCDYPCQRAHWAAHYSHCTQRKKKDDKGDKLEGDQSPRTSIQTDNLPALQKSVQTPSVSVSGKNVGTRVYADTNAASKTSIIVKMVDDNAGNQTMKCVGTYKSPSQTQVQQPLLINKQMMADENTSKKVVTSGGYLIVGAGNNTALITPSTAGGRRPNNIQYFT